MAEECRRSVAGMAVDAVGTAVLSALGAAGHLHQAAPPDIDCREGHISWVN